MKRIRLKFMPFGAACIFTWGQCGTLYRQHCSGLKDYVPLTGSPLSWVIDFPCWTIFHLMRWPQKLCYLLAAAITAASEWPDNYQSAKEIIQAANQNKKPGAG